MTDLEIDNEVERFVNHYMDMRNKNPESFMYKESMWAYSDMSSGGRGFDGNKTYIRDEYYKGYPDVFFTRVLVGLGELELAMQNPETHANR